jgi:ribosomal protein S12 methylthiotransferase accessory factor
MRGVPAVISEIFGRRVGIVNALDLVEPQLGDAAVWIAKASSASGLPVWGTDLASSGGGAGLDPETARLAALGEAAERYAAAGQDGHEISICRPEELEGGPEWRDHMPDQWPLEPEGAKWGWVRASNGRFIPAAAVFIPYRHSKDEWVPFPSISSGLAAGQSEAEASERAALELIERDAVARFWYSRGSLARRIEARDVPDDVARAFSSARLTAEVFSLDSCDSVPVAFVVLTGMREGRRIVSTGSACSRTWASACRKSFVEAAHAQGYARHLLSRPEERKWPPEDFADHAAWPSLRAADWDRARDFFRIIASGNAPPEYVGAMRDDFLYVDLTPGDLRLAGVFVVRAAHPLLLPIPGHDRARARRHPRWPDRENEWPHPMP